MGYIFSVLLGSIKLFSIKNTIKIQHKIKLSGIMIYIDNYLK
jgi:hypothetical protein